MKLLKTSLVMLFCGLVLGLTANSLAHCGTCGVGEKKEAPHPEPKEPKPAEAEVKTVQVLLTTSKGEILLELNKEKAPISVENFLSYTQEKYYDETIFHRVIPGFMVQGGGMTKDMTKKKTKKPIKNEGSNGLSNARGTIAMARTGDPDSATSQFFINVADNTNLDYKSPQSPGYAVFGKVIKGMDVADAIVSVKTTRKKGMGNVPVEPIIIKSVKLVEPKTEKK